MSFALIIVETFLFGSESLEKIKNHRVSLWFTVVYLYSTILMVAAIVFTWTVAAAGLTHAFLYTPHAENSLLNQRG